MAAGGAASSGPEGEHLDVCRYLARRDKWFVAGGSSSVYAPPNPQWSETPGFWDEIHLGRSTLPRLFTLLLLDEAGRSIPLRFLDRHWQPDRLVQSYGTPDLEVLEERVNLALDAFVSRLSLRNTSGEARSLHLILWSWQPRLDEGPCVEEAQVEGGRLRYRLRLADDPRFDRHPRLDLHVVLGADRPADSGTINLTEPHAPGPEYRYSPLREKFRGGRLAGESVLAAGVRETREGPIFAGGHVHFALHYHLELAAGEEARIAAGGSVGFTRDWAESGVGGITSDAPERSRAAWATYFRSVPSFACSDAYVQKFYWYRWYQLRAHQVNGVFGGFQRPCIVEGIGPFRQHISYSAQCHMRECQWMHDPAWAYGSLENMLASQQEDGSLPGHVNERGVAGAAGSITERVSFYHANWANAWRVYQIHGERAFLERIYPGLARYARYFLEQRDPEGSHLFDVINQGETGQEYMPRYQAVDPHADDWGPFRLKGVDATCYLYELLVALARMARALDAAGSEVAFWEEQARAVRQAVRERMWDAEHEIFCDVDPEGMRRTGVKSAVCFYPFMSDLASEEHLPAIRRHLLDPAEFWTAWPFPSTSAVDPLFSAEGEWKGKRTNCPWNGRVWPMTNSHLCEALAEAARRHDPSLTPAAVQALRRFVELMFFDHDPERPNSWEHYNPHTGAPCDYRGVDDYQHSWVVDLILRYVAGIQPGDDGEVVVDPLPTGLEFDADSIRIRGHRLRAAYSGSEGFRIWVDGALRHHSAQPHLVRLNVP